MEGLLELLPEEDVQKLKSVSERMSIPEKEIVRRSVEAYIRKLEGMEEEFELVGFGMWKDRSEMGNSSKWVEELRKEEWNR
ncbi:MAG: hypothetical protein U9O59_00390 [Actinomycetota bacterium]|nr:hypothetical protein [Actinomycetota bacterium]